MSPIILRPLGGAARAAAHVGGSGPGSAAAGSSAAPRHEVEASRALERLVGPAALAHPGAAAAAGQVLERLLGALAWAYPEAPIDAKALLGASLPARPQAVLGASLQLGDVAPQDVETALREGGIQTLVSMIRRTEGVMAPLLHQLAVLAEGSPSFAGRLRDELGMDAALLVARRQEVARDYGDDPSALFCPPASSPVADIPAMRRRPGPQEPTHGQIWSDAALSPDPGASARRHMQQVGAALVSGGAPIPTRPGADGELAYRLPEAVGTLRFRPQSAHPWHRDARARGMYTAVSISGTTYRLLWLARLLGGDDGHLQDFTLALVGHMVPRHHAYHEVMSAAAEHGVPYTPTLDSMRATARRLAVDERPRPSGPSVVDLPDVLLERIVARGRAADLPHILLAAKALSRAARRQADLPAGRSVVLRRLRCARDRAQVLNLFSSPWAGRLLGNLDHLPLARRGLDGSDLETIAGLAPGVRSLDLDGNPLVWAADRGARLRPWLMRLNRLTLRDNGLREVPAVLGGLPRLTHLVLDDNPLGTLPAWLGELPSLESLSAAGAELSRVELASAPGGAGRLRELNLQYNPALSAWPLAAGAAPHLQRLSLHRTAISAPPRSARPPSLSLETSPLGPSPADALPGEAPAAHVEPLPQLQMSSTETATLTAWAQHAPPAS